MPAQTFEPLIVDDLRYSLTLEAWRLTIRQEESGQYVQKAVTLLNPWGICESGAKLGRPEYHEDAEHQQFILVALYPQLVKAMLGDLDMRSATVDEVWKLLKGAACLEQLLFILSELDNEEHEALQDRIFRRMAAVGNGLPHWGPRPTEDELVRGVLSLYSWDEKGRMLVYGDDPTDGWFITTLDNEEE